LITGGSGYLGSHLARAAAANWETHATYLTHAATLPGVTMHRLDIRSAPAVNTLVMHLRPQVIIHTAARLSGDDMMAVNVDGTRHIAQAAVQVGARLIHLSSDVIFDGQQGWYTETDPPRPIHEYGHSKALAETIVQASVPAAVIVRTSLITGLNPVDPRTRWVLDSLRECRPIILFTDEYRCPIWVADLTTALLELARLDYTGILNIAGPEALSRYDLGVKLARAYGLDPAGITAASSTSSGLVRPRDCRLDIHLARRLLSTRLRSIDEGFNQKD